jgi:D-alanyl-D-alanine endopeptidase (penicillin-binding protein 7)
MLKLILTILFFIHTQALADTNTVFVYNLTKNQTIVSENENQIRPIASITKLMTAIVVLESGANLSEKLPVKNLLFFKSFATREELLMLSLVKSDNEASEILAKNYFAGREMFIEAMNRKAEVLRMTNTTFTDPTGISAGNVSTAKDLGLLLSYANTQDKIQKITSLANYTIEIKGKKTTIFEIKNTNKTILEQFDFIQISKTGTTSKAGKCLAMFATKNSDQHVLVFLGFKDRKQLENAAKDILNKI